MDNELDLTGDGGVLKTTTRKAKADAIGPTTELSIVDVHYKVLFPETGKVIWNTRKDGIASFKISENDAIKGLDIALRTMKVGEKATITCKPAYAHGSAGSSSDIPPNATLIFKVEIMGWRHRESANPGIPTDDVPSIEKLKKWFSTPARSGEEGKKFLEQKKEKMEKMREAEEEGGIYDLTCDGGVTKKILKKAGADAIGPTEDLRIVVVCCHSGSALTRTGEIRDSIEGHHPVLTFEIGAGDVIIGWDIALRSMKVGDIAKITCKPEYTRGNDPDMLPDVTLISTLELLACRHWTSPIPGSPSKEEARLWAEAGFDEIGVGIVALVRAKLDEKNDQRKGKAKLDEKNYQRKGKPKLGAKNYQRKGKAKLDAKIYQRRTSKRKVCMRWSSE